MLVPTMEVPPRPATDSLLTLRGLDLLQDLQLPEEDLIPMETLWHRYALNFLSESIRYLWRGRTDHFVGGNMFVYYSPEQALAVQREVAAEFAGAEPPPPEERAYRGPDFFVVKNVGGDPLRRTWVVWEEGHRFPDVIVELASPSTAKVDLTMKKTLYERIFRTPDYFVYDPDRRKLQGWRLHGGLYEPLPPNAQGWLWSQELQLWLGLWEGPFQGAEAVWLRFFDAEGHLVLIGEEAERQRAEAERQRAEAERQRAEAAEAELARLRARLATLEPNEDS